MDKQVKWIDIDKGQINRLDDRVQIDDRQNR